MLWMGQACRVTADLHHKGRATGSRSGGQRLASGRALRGALMQRKRQESQTGAWSHQHSRPRAHRGA